MAISRDSFTDIDRSALTSVFGEVKSDPTDIESWAKQSSRQFVRSQTQIAHWVEGATGRILSAHESLKAFKWSVMKELAEKPSTVIVREGCDAATVLRARREETGFSHQQLASKIGISENDIIQAETGRKRSPFEVIQRLGEALALEAEKIGVVLHGGGDTALAQRLRDVQQTQGALSPTVVLGLAEAAWVIATQSRLEDWLNPGRNDTIRNRGFIPISPRNLTAPWQQGIELAHRTRDILSLGQSAPIKRLKELFEDQLSIPVILVDLPDRFAGATIANGETRGVVTNVKGINANVWVRRMTMAHELGHLLWDRDEDLNRLKIDAEAAFEASTNQSNDKFEVRANAFAAEFLAPQRSVVSVYKSAGKGEAGVSAVMQEFGISFTASKWQITNGLRPSAEPAPERSLRNTVPGDAWEADETGTIDYFPIKETPISRRGKFAKLVLDALKENLIGEDTAARYLRTTIPVFRDKLNPLRSLLS